MWPFVCNWTFSIVIDVSIFYEILYIGFFIFFVLKVTKIPWCITFGCALLLANITYLLQWALMTLQDSKASLANLIYIGYTGDPASVFHITRKRRLDRKKQRTQRNVFQCFVFGPKNAGKTTLLNSFIGRWAFTFLIFAINWSINLSCCLHTVHRCRITAHKVCYILTWLLRDCIFISSFVMQDILWEVYSYNILSFCYKCCWSSQRKCSWTKKHHLLLLLLVHHFSP